MVDIHCLNGLLIIPITLFIAVISLVQHRRGKGLTPLVLAAALIVALQLVFQVYMGILMLSDRLQRSVLHYTLGLLPLLLLLIAFWLIPQLRARRALAVGIVFLVASVTAALAFLLE